MHRWLTAQRRQLPDGTATATASDHSLRRWQALTRYIDDSRLPIDSNQVENHIRLITLGRNNWLAAGSLPSGKRATVVMSPIHSVRLNGYGSYAYLRDVLQRLPMQPASRTAALLPHRWVPAAG